MNMKITKSAIVSMLICCIAGQLWANNVTISAVDATDDIIMVLDENDALDGREKCEVSLARVSSDFSGTVEISTNSATEFKVYDEETGGSEVTSLTVTNGNFDGGTPLVSVYVEGLAKGSGTITVDLKDDSGTSKSTDSVDVIIVKVLMKEISFGGNTDEYLQLVPDDLSTPNPYEAPQWKDESSTPDGDADDTGDKNYSVAYVKGKTWKIGAKFDLDPSLEYESVKVKATFSNGLTLGEQSDDSTSGTLTHSSTSSFGEVELPLTALTGSSPDTIKFYDRNGTSALEVTWEVDVEDVGWTTVATTKHQVYVTLEKPDAGKVADYQETLFYFACHENDGLTGPEATLVGNCWKEFSNFPASSVFPKTYRLNPKTGDPSSEILYFTNQESYSSGTTGGILGKRTGVCETWAELFQSVLAVHQVEVNIVDLSPDAFMSTDYPASDWDYISRRWFVKSQDKSSSGTWFDPTASTNRGQGGVHTVLYWGSHAICHFGGSFYDPSYGAMGTNEIDYEDNAVIGYGITVQKKANHSIMKDEAWNRTLGSGKRLIYNIKPY